MKKFAETLAREYDRETKEDYYQIIEESAVNGQWSQIKSQFNARNQNILNEAIEYRNMD